MVSFVLVSFPQIKVTKANDIVIYIRADGTVEPETAPIEQNGSIYFLTGNVGKILIERSYMVFDGNGYEVTHNLEKKRQIRFLLCPLRFQIECNISFSIQSLHFWKLCKKNIRL